jgi:hypothetical protein
MNNKKYWLDKKYWILLPPFLVIGILLFIYLPGEHRKFVLLVPIVFWATYYTWRYMDKTRRLRNNNHPQ